MEKSSNPFCFSSPSVTWWISDPDLPALAWYRLRVHEDGVCDVWDVDGILHGFPDEDSASTFLREEEYDEWNAELRKELSEQGVDPAKMNPPQFLVNDEPLREPIADCQACGACWSDGFHTLNCEECGGGALTRRCPSCSGNCVLSGIGLYSIPGILRLYIGLVTARQSNDDGAEPVKGFGLLVYSEIRL